MDHQDFKPVVLRRKKTKIENLKAGETTVVRKIDSSNKNTQGTTMGPKAAHDFDPENVTKIATSNHDLKTAIMKARQAKSLTQSQLDGKCNFKKNTVRDYENGTAIIVSKELTLMGRVLGVKLPRPKKK